VCSFQRYPDGARLVVVWQASRYDVESKTDGNQVLLEEIKRHKALLKDYEDKEKQVIVRACKDYNYFNTANSVR